MKSWNLPTFFSMMLLLAVSCNSDEDPEGPEFTSGNIETFAGMGPDNFGYEGDNGLATKAKLGYVTGIAVDGYDNIYYTDGAANLVRKIATGNNTITTVAGTFIGFNQVNNNPYSGDGGSATLAHLNIPLATVVDLSGNIIIADAGNNVVRKVSASNGSISTVAGKGPGFVGYDGDGGLATQSKIWNPYSVAYDSVGNIYFADAQNNAIRMVALSTGKISTIAGLGPNNPGYSGDNGPASSARLREPQGIGIDGDGNIYISDTGNKVIRKIANGVITTIAGTGIAGYGGDDGPATSATFVAIKGIDIDDENNIYIADSGNNVIRRIDAATGKITTVAGTGTAGYTGDGGMATTAQLSSPLGVALDSHGNLYIADSQNSVIRIVFK
jgi:trimeric autotransporter adhesin